MTVLIDASLRKFMKHNYILLKNKFILIENLQISTFLNDSKVKLVTIKEHRIQNYTNRLTNSPHWLMFSFQPPIQVHISVPTMCN